jgi:apolipoprotein N-acyltransferase
MAETILEYGYTLVTIVLLAYFLRRSLIAQLTTKQLVKNWIAFGILFNLFTLSWHYTIYPLMWMKEGVVQLLGIATLHVILSLCCGLCFFIVGFAFNHKTHQALRPFLFALTLAVAEIIRSLTLSALYYGNQSTFDLHWGAGTTGNALSVTPFIEYAYFGGTYMLSFIFGYLMYICISKKHFFTYIYHGAVISILLVLIHYVIPVRGPVTPIHVSVVTTDFELPHETTESGLRMFFKKQADVVHTMTKTLASSTPNIIVYPEDTRYVSNLTLETNNELLPLFKNTIFIDGDTQKTQDGFSNYSIFYSPSEKKLLGRGKALLTPFNEYIPEIFEKLFLVFISQEEFATYTTLHTYTPVYQTKVFVTKSLRVGTLICSEVLSFATIRSVYKERPDILFHQSHLNVFRNNPWFMMHIQSMSKITAAQTRTPFIGSGNRAPSLAISPYGEIINVIPASFSTTTYIISSKEIRILK